MMSANYFKFKDFEVFVLPMLLTILLSTAYLLANPRSRKFTVERRLSLDLMEIVVDGSSVWKTNKKISS